MKSPRLMKNLAVAVCAAALLSGALTACVPLVVGGALAGGTLVATDRRTPGAQLDDETIELKASSRIRSEMGTRVRVSVTSYNRQVLLTGEVPSLADKQLVEQIAAKVETVASVIDELAVMNSPTLMEQSADGLLTGRVKAALLDAKELHFNTFKVVTERGVTYLMGRVTQREADLAAEVVRTTSGVQKVVRIFEIITPEELQRIQSAAPTPVPESTAPKL